MHPSEISSQVWREHCQRVRAADKAFRERERGFVRMGYAFMPKPKNYTDRYYFGGRKNPSVCKQIAWGLAIALTFSLGCLVL